MEGWNWLANATKWHYFKDGRSLCGRWLILNNSDAQQGNDNSRDNCSACRSKLARNKAYCQCPTLTEANLLTGYCAATDKCGGALDHSGKGNRLSCGVCGRLVDTHSCSECGKNILAATLKDKLQATDSAT